jgi:SAM-dependent methyltransferase/ABC-type cobalamin/Fe3+-siderophores transport system ATPase subunit
MKIVSFQPTDDEVRRVGLHRVRFERLGDLVVLAGPNGGGKSRVFQLLESAHNAVGPDRHTFRKTNEEDRKAHIAALRSYEKGEQPDISLEGLEQWRAVVSRAEANLARLDALKIEPDARSVQLLHFVPKRLHLTDPGTLNHNEALARAKRVREAKVESIADDVLAYVQNVQDRYREATHKEPSGTPEEQTEAIRQHGTLCELIKALLGTDLGRSVDRVSELFGRPIATSGLSDGQRVLLQLAAEIHPTHDDHSLVLLMDEPENHLHPAALIAVLDRIRVALPQAQVWVATHSVPLLAHLYARSPESLHFVADGVVEFAGTKPQAVLGGLLGNEEEQAKLLSFIDLPHQVAATQFASCCLQAPSVVGHQVEDKQLVQIRDILLRGKAEGAPVKILDLGAGKGRLLGGLAEVNGAQHLFDYVALDISADNKGECERQIAAVYDNANQRWYPDPDSLFADHGQSSFDVVIMCNVLHEIDPDHWLTVIGPKSVADLALKPMGSLLIVEDLRIPVGELPNARGFFLLDTLHLRRLFAADQPIDNGRILAADAKGDGRLKAHAIPRDLVVRACDSTRKAAVESLKATAARELANLRSAGKTTYKAGHLNALWSQQYTNCGLYLGVIGGH